jgi:prepilin-type N-terminal cleavage/methylation domain-containing protein
MAMHTGSHPSPTWCSRGTSRAFTLIELLVVIAIIGILAALVLTVAGRVTKSGRRTLTQHTIGVLDQMYTSYVADKESGIRSKFTADNGVEFPIVDGKVTAGGGPAYNTNPPEASMALFLLEIGKRGPSGIGVSGLDSKLLDHVTVVSHLGTPFVRDADNNLVTSFLTVKDAFGNPIRFVHPAYQGGYGVFYNPVSVNRPPLNVTRIGNPANIAYSRSMRPFVPGAAGVPPDAVGDADEGICTGGRAYFYSAGADGDPGTREDNVYTQQPTFPAETASAN